MEEFTNEFELARNFGFDITMPDGNMGLSSAAHIDYMNKCTALYKTFLYNMNSIIRFEKETKKKLSKLHREKMNNLRFSLYRSANANTENDPFAKVGEYLSVSFTGLESRQNTPWGLGTVPHEEDEETDVRPHTAPANISKRNDSFTKSQRTRDGDVTDNDDNEEEQLSTTDLSDQLGIKDEVFVGILDAKTEKKIVVGQHSFLKLGSRSVKAKLKNRDGLFEVTPLKIELQPSNLSTVAFDPNKSKTDYDPVNEKVAMVKKETNYLSPTIASDMKINNKIPIQKSLKGLEAKRTTVVEIYRNSRDRRTRHIRIVPRQQKLNEPKARLSVAKTKIRSAFFLQSFARASENANGETSRKRTESESSVVLRSSSRVAFAREDSNSGQPGERESQSRLAFVRPESQLSNTVFQSNREHLSLLKRSDSQMSNSRTLSQRDTSQSQMLLTRSDSQLSNPRSPVQRIFNQVVSSTPNAVPERKHGIQNNGWFQNELNESFSSNQSIVRRRQSISSVASAAGFVNKLKKTISPETKSNKLGFTVPRKIDSQIDTKKIVKQQMIKDRELDDQMTSWRKRMTIRSSAMSKNRMKPGGGRMKLI